MKVLSLDSRVALAHLLLLGHPRCRRPRCRCPRCRCPRRQLLLPHLPDVRNRRLSRPRTRRSRTDRRCRGPVDPAPRRAGELAWAAGASVQVWLWRRRQRGPRPRTVPAQACPRILRVVGRTRRRSRVARDPAPVILRRRVPVHCECRRRRWRDGSRDRRSRPPPGTKGPRGSVPRHSRHPRPRTPRRPALLGGAP